ncbi:TetR/AcrR family transcriptional regulator [Niabella beijingensis]|uniref:TetR/AcrR family transcriptional regulator n=1 Tax=Niabella beijingensis TaxID=2872700 RepID=UPI001CBFD9C6|nr:TetR/AcrR family transcriptional regulator [Niabella beijingensis]MBZ4189126.1 TetR/AcrR family transcriptional regulator [Niabella beijingensis]
MKPRDDAKEALIRRKAIALIVRLGFDGFSMQKLAKDTGLSPSTLYVYFENREDLLLKLYTGVLEKFEQDALAGFSETMPFEEGLWLQWKNRFKNICKNPTEYRFYEQFRNSPLLRHQAPAPTAFRNAMNQFVKNAVRSGTLKQLPPEIFWSLAYGPFYTLVKFHLDQSSMAGTPFSLTEQKLKQAFLPVLQALKP